MDASLNINNNLPEGCDGDADGGVAAAAPRRDDPAAEAAAAPSCRAVGEAQVPGGSSKIPPFRE